jgi:putative membrane protein
MFRVAALLGLLGLAAATCVIVWSGWGEVTQALMQSGWGILAVAAFHGVQLAVSSLSWRVLIPGKRSPSWPMFIYFMWIRASVNNLMPVARIGGEIASVRLMTAYGMRRNIAIASTLVELTVSIAAIFLFVILGVILFALHVNDHNLVMQLAWGLALSAPLVGVLFVVQRIGIFGLLSRLFNMLFRDKWAALVGHAARIDRSVALLYRRQGRIAASFALQFIAWSLGSVEIWLSLQFLGHPLPLLTSAMLEALIQGSASAAFAIPGALGIQEAGFVLFGDMLGLPPGIATAVAVMRRCRDLLFYVPGLVVWQTHEGKKLLSR